MNRSSIGYVPLQNYFQLPEDLLLVDVSCLKSVANDTDRPANMARILNILASCKCSTLGDVLALNWNEISDLRSVGAVYESYLFDLLDRIMEDPKAFRNKHSLNNRIRSLGNVHMNVDLKTRKCTLHKPACVKIPMDEDILPAMESEDAVGWIDFDTIEETITFHKAHHKHWEYRLCRLCFAKEAQELFKIRGTNLPPQYPI